jgi:hypothetical protein
MGTDAKNKEHTQTKVNRPVHNACILTSTLITHVISHAILAVCELTTQTILQQQQQQQQQLMSSC